MNEKLTPEQPPKKIYLQWYTGDPSADIDSYDAVTWCADKINDDDFEYILTAHTAEDEYNASKYGTFQPAQQIWKDWMMSHARSIGTDFEEWFRVRYAAEDDDPAIEAKNEFERGIIL